MSWDICDVMNHLLIILDSVSYEVFNKAKTPNIRKLGEIEEAWTPGYWTLPTVVSMFHIPFYTGKPLIGSGSYLPHVWLPSTMKRCGFETTLISDNPWFDLCKDFISRGFDNYITHRMIDMKWVLKTGKKYLNPKFFTVLWITGTHHHGIESGSDGIDRVPYTMGWQINAIERMDKKLGRFFKKIPEDTELVVTSDHGDAYSGDKLIGHHPMKVQTFDERLLKVFLVRKNL